MKIRKIINYGIGFHGTERSGMKTLDSKNQNFYRDPIIRTRTGQGRKSKVGLGPGSAGRKCPRHRRPCRTMTGRRTTDNFDRTSENEDQDVEGMTTTSLLFP